MTEMKAVRYTPGKRIDVARPLEVVNLPRSKWWPIGQDYPEIGQILALRAAAAPFGANNTTIFPPAVVPMGILKRSSHFNDATKRSYPFYQGERLVAVVVHVFGKNGDYDAVYTYRLNREAPRRHWLRRS